MCITVYVCLLVLNSMKIVHFIMNINKPGTYILQSDLATLDVKKRSK